MANKKLSKSAMQTLVTACVALVIGILFSCSLEFGTRGLSYLIGVSIIIAGALYSINTVINHKTLLTAYGLMGAAVISFGVMFMVREMAGIIVDYIPWLMISVGISALIDAFLRFFVKKCKVLAFVLELIAGSAITALGFCIKFVAGWADFAALVFGISLIAYAVFMIITVFIKKN